MIAVPGDNCDIWLLVHSYKYPKFKAYHITRDGIDPTPVISTAGAQLSGSSDPMGAGIFPYSMGGMAISPDRQRLALVSSNPGLWLLNWMPGIAGNLLCKFDPSTGAVSDAVSVGPAGGQSYVPAFSPDNSKLYLGYFGLDMTNFSNRVHTLRQYTISSHDSATIANSEVIIDTLPGATLFGGIAYLKLYNDTIYICEERQLSALGTINQPNLNGTACDYQSSSVSLGTLETRNNLPGEVVYLDPPDTVGQTVLDTMLCAGWVDGIELRPTEAGASYAWNDSSSDTTLTIFGEGVYWVRYSNGYGCTFRVDTFKLSGGDLIPPVITVNVYELATVMNNYASYQWLLDGEIIPGANQNSYTVLENGIYQVIVSNDQGCVDTSEIYEVTNVSIKKRRDILASIRVYPNPVHEAVFVRAPVPVKLCLSTINGTIIHEEVEANTFSMRGQAAGMYLLRISDKDGQLLKVEKLIKVKK